MQALAGLKASFAQMAEMGGFGAVATAAHSGCRGGEPRPPRRQFVRHRRWIGCRADRLEEGRKTLGRAPRARIRAFATVGSDLGLMLTGPVDVTKLVLKKAGMTTKDIDLFELNEAFSSVVLRFPAGLRHR